MSILRMLLGGTLILASVSPLWAQDSFDLPKRPAGPYEIRGIVVDGKTGEPLPEVELSFQENAQPAGPPFEIIQSDASGNFRVANLSEGKYTIRGSRQGYAPLAYLQHENFWTGIAVGPGKDSLHVRFPMSPSATIVGQVTSDSGEAVRGATVTLWMEQIENGVRSITQSETANTDDEGRYRLEHLLPGKYSVSVHAMPWYSRYAAPRVDAGVAYLPDVVYPTLFYPNTRDWHGMEWISLRPGQVEDADFHLVPEPSAHVQVQIGADSNARSNISLTSEFPGGTSYTVEYSSVNVSAGVMEISGIAAGHYRIQGQRENLRQELDVTGTAQLEFDAPVTSGTTIRGSIQVADGDPKLGFGILQLKDTNGHTYLAQFHGDWGDAAHPAVSFEFENVPAESQAFEVSIVQPQDLVVRKIEAKAAKVSGTTFELDGEHEPGLVITVSQVSHAITGIVMKQGKPLAGAMVLLMPQNAKDWERLVRRDQSDSDGTFRLATILPGKYLLVALEHGWDIEWSRPEVLQPFLNKALRLEISEKPLEAVSLDAQ